MSSKSVYNKEYRKKNKEKIRKKAREWLKTDKGRLYRLRHKNKIDIDFEEYQRMFIKQKNLCAICKRPEQKKSLAIDHCHKTGKVRGLLCQKCNRGIGCFDDNVELLKNAIHYLI